MEHAEQSSTGGQIEIRAARAEDAEAVASILAEAFPALYRATFGRLAEEELAWLLAELYRASLLALGTTRVCERGGWVVGVAVLHGKGTIGQGNVRDYWRLLRQQLGLWRAPRAFWGGLLANAYLSRRIPQADDLIYIEALAVAAPERGRGIGTRLLEDVADQARGQGRTRLALHVLHSNVGARRLYERMGFRLQGPAEPPPHSGFSPQRVRWYSLLMTRSLIDTPPTTRE